MYFDLGLLKTRVFINSVQVMDTCRISSLDLRSKNHCKYEASRSLEPPLKSVLGAGLEPASLAAPAPKAGAFAVSPPQRMPASILIEW